MDNTVGSFGSLYLGVNNKAVRKIRDSLKLSKIQKSFIYGTMLGDGCIYGQQSSHQEKNYRLQIIQSNKQKELVLWKYEILKNFILKEPKYLRVNNSWRFRTISHPEITEIYNLFYKNGKKRLPDNIKEILKDKLSLAVWFMDDGNISRYGDKIRGYHINTQSFSYEENLKLSELFKNILGLEIFVPKNKGKYRLYIGSKSRIIFPKLIEKNIIPSLRYKLGSQI